MAFCVKCGAQLSQGMAFCGKCGARVQAPAGVAPGSAAPAPAAVPSPPTVPPVSKAPAATAPPSVPMASAPPQPAGAPTNTGAPPVPPKKSGNLVLKIVLGVLGLFALITVLAVGSCVYIGYRIKKKADQAEEAYKKANMGKVLGALGQAASQGSSQGQPGSAPDIGKILGALGQAASQAGGQGAAQGTPGGQPSFGQILGALGQAMNQAQAGGGVPHPAGTCPSGDPSAYDGYIKAAAAASIPLEPGMTLTDIWTDPDRALVDTEILDTVEAASSNEIETTEMRLDGKSMEGKRNLCIADLLGGRELETTTGTGVPQTIPGATKFSLSKAEFADLIAGRPAAVNYYEARDSGTGYLVSDPKKGNLSRVESGDVPYSIIVNGATENLPTIHAKGVLGGNAFEAWVLDDAANPIILNFVAPQVKWHITYVKITFPVKKQVEQQLAQTGRAEIYGIYFDFNKSVPRPESAPVLKEIAQALKDNPAWKLRIEGHTDNIGGDAYNLKLSQERAGGVKQSLITQYGIAADRLSAQGYGDTRPKATNDTVEGRALNRRVELVRE